MLSERSQSQEHRYYTIPLRGDTGNNQIHRERNYSDGFKAGWGWWKWGRGSYCVKGAEFQSGQMKTVLEKDGGDGYTTL